MDQPESPPARPPRRRRAVLPWVLGILVGFLLLPVVLVVGAVSSFGGGVFDQEGRRVVLDDEEDEQGVFVEIPVEGVIADTDVGGGNPVARVKACLEAAGREPRLKGILLRVNSPGGGIRASAEILKALRDFKAEHHVPVVVWMKDVAASGGYYVSMASDWIVAHESTITASIGVIWNTMNWEGLMKEKLGIELDNLKSAPMKDIGSPNRPMATKERELIQGIVDEAFARFVAVVVAGRAGKGKTPVTEESVRALESTILPGTRAYEAGLVDALGYRDDALGKLEELAGVSRADVVEFVRPKSLVEMMLGARADAPGLPAPFARIEYLYLEGPALLALWER